MTSWKVLFGMLAVLSLAISGCAADSSEGEEDDAVGSDADALTASDMTDTGNLCVIKKKFYEPRKTNLLVEAGPYDAIAGIKGNQLYLRFRATNADERGTHNNAHVTRIFPDGTVEKGETDDNFVALGPNASNFTKALVHWPSDRKPNKTGMKYKVAMVIDIGHHIDDPTCDQDLHN
jgi:hypothetical protein